MSVAKDVFESGVLMSETPDWFYENQLKMYSHPIDSYGTKYFRKADGDKTYRSYMLDDNNMITFKYVSGTNVPFLKLFGLPVNKELDILSSVKSFIGLIKKYPNTKVSVNEKESKILLNTFSKLGIDYEVSFLDYDFYESIESKLEIMRTKKWQKDKVRGLFNIDGVEFVRLTEEHYLEMRRLLNVWAKNKKNYYKDSFYQRIITDPNYYNHIAYGLLYKGQLVYMEFVYPYGNSTIVKADLGLGIFRVPKNEWETKFPNIPKKVIEYSNLACRYKMYEEYLNLGYNNVYVDGVGTNTTLAKNKMQNYDKHIKRYLFSLKKK